jgi:hypothetical protein
MAWDPFCASPGCGCGRRSYYFKRICCYPACWLPDSCPGCTQYNSLSSHVPLVITRLSSISPAVPGNARTGKSPQSTRPARFQSFCNPCARSESVVTSVCCGIHAVPHLFPLRRSLSTLPPRRTHCAQTPALQHSPAPTVARCHSSLTSVISGCRARIQASYPR